MPAVVADAVQTPPAQPGDGEQAAPPDTTDPAWPSRRWPRCTECQLTANPASPRATDGCMYSRGIAAASRSPSIAWLFVMNSTNLGSGSVGAVDGFIVSPLELRQALIGVKSQFLREVGREIIDGLVVEQDRRRQPALDDLLQCSRNLDGGTRIEAVGVERLGRVDLRFGAFDPARQVGDQPSAQRLVGQRSVDGVTAVRPNMVSAFLSAVCELPRDARFRRSRLIAVAIGI